MLLIKTGSTLSKLRGRGDFEDWFAHHLQAGKPHVVNVQQGQELPPPQQVPAALITGSPAMVSTEPDWVCRTAQWIRAYISTGQPLLGVCFGHQLIAYALGGVVGPNPNGRALGSTEVHLTHAGQEDPLFQHIRGTSFVGHVAHQEVVIAPPHSATVLATAAHDPFHALRFNENVWGVQFHPEFDADISAGYIDHRIDELAREGFDIHAARATIRHCPEASAILAVFRNLTTNYEPVYA